MEQNAGKKNIKSFSPTPYDDVFRTLLNDCSELIIPVINEIFHEDYVGTEQIVFSPNEHFMNMQDGVEDKRITDTSFMIVGKEKKKYLYECQSVADSSMLVRIFEYSTQIALDAGKIVGNTLKVDIPNCAVLFLRSTRSTPDTMKIAISAESSSMEFDIIVMKAKDYSLDEIFDRKLLFLIPFYIFSHEARFEEYNDNAEMLERLKAEYVFIINRLDALLKENRISAYTRKTILEMSNKVLENIAAKYDNVKEGVKSIMGGRVLEHEAKTIFEEGSMKKAKETAVNLYKKGMDEKTIAEVLNVNLDLIREWILAVTA